jgi:energy-coupling factor transporter ATP-binding protein EcfA2
MRSKLLEITVRNIGCIGQEPVSVRLDDVLCLVGSNNSGKTTILRAYELAFNPAIFEFTRDRCNWAGPDEPSEILLDVHIPTGMGNVDEKWKIVAGNNRIVRSRWSWPLDGGKVVRQTWDPVAEDWAEDGKAGGADNVFRSRLPKPMRIGSLDDALTTQDVLLTLALKPLINELKISQADEGSQLSKDKQALTETVNSLSKTHQERIDAISEKVKVGFQGVFPNLGVKLHVEMASPELNLETLLKKGSGIRIEEPTGPAQLAQQGTGARRALFWSMLQVHNEISRDTERREALLKAKKAELAKETKKKEPVDELVTLLNSQIQALDNGGPIPEDAEDPALPGYILLMDEPENALHPMAARAAQQHLYELANHADWQVLITTHSPYFINPLADHTTIARLERSRDGKSLSPKLYVADDATFSAQEKADLQALQLMDTSLSEIFFGSYPVLVEGDTEDAAFVAAAVKPKHAISKKVSIIRARGKAVLVPLIKMLHHFKANFGVIHDVDWPLRSDGARNGMWTINSEIRKEILACRDAGLRVSHRWSVPDYERFLGGEELGKDKPYQAFARVSVDEALKARIVDMMQSIFDGEVLDHAGHNANENFEAQIEAELVAWAAANGEEANPRLKNPNK